MQPLDATLNKTFKGFHRELHEWHLLNAPENDKGQPISPSRQLCAQWAVEAWDEAPEELVAKAWRICGHKSMEEIQDSSGGANNSLALTDTRSIARVIEMIAGGMLRVIV